MAFNIRHTQATDLVELHSNISSYPFDDNLSTRRDARLNELDKIYNHQLRSLNRISRLAHSKFVDKDRLINARP